MSVRQNRRASGAPGIPVDSSGGATIDPTKNVLDLVGAAVLRLSDMMQLQAKLTDEKILRMEREYVHQEKMAERERAFSAEIRKMESDRVDKIRSVDVANAAATAAQLLSAVNNLAVTADRTAETLRNQVAATAQAAAANLGALINPVIERVAILEKTAYTGLGKSSFADPQVERNTQLLEALARAQAQTTGKGAGLNMAWLALTGLAALVFGAVGAGGVVWAILHAGAH
jgi:hypothetical protein